MRKIIFIAAILILSACTPGKSGIIVTASIYCDSCYVTLKNYGGVDVEFVSSELITNYGIITIDRFKSENSCVSIYAVDDLSFSNDTVSIYFIQKGDTIGFETSPINFNYCY